MSFRIVLYRFFSWLRHRFTAVNTMGHGIHSPYLYNMVRFVLYDDNAYYCFRDIETERRRLLASDAVVQVEDYGTGTSGVRRIADIAAVSLKSSSEAQFLFRLVRFLHPAVSLELGTSLGITSAYLSVATAGGVLLTMEGSPSLALEAEKVFRHLALVNIRQVTGNIDDTLERTLQTVDRVDFAFLDANHTQSATQRYFEAILSRCHEKTVLVIDDIHYSPDMEAVWRLVSRGEKVTATMDFYHFGIIFFDTQLMKKNYILRM